MGIIEFSRWSSLPDAELDELFDAARNEVYDAKQGRQ